MNFEAALRHTLDFEGGYANDPDDNGGETFRGISRKNWPHWGGWDLIDQVKRSGVLKPRDIDAAFRMDAAMDCLVSLFYRENFWAPFERLDIPLRVTAKLFDTAVNVGVGQAVKFLQRAVNALKAAGPLTADGVAGPKTKSALAHTLIAPEDERDMLDQLLKEQEAHYRAIVAKKPSQAKFMNGWLRRATWVPA